jgi:hypothetical protein
VVTSDCEKTSQSSQQIYQKVCSKTLFFVLLYMQHIQGISRNQLQIVSLEDKIIPDNLFRFIDAFVNHIDLNKIGFESKVLKAEGRPSFQTQVFLKLYLYGYLICKFEFNRCFVNLNLFQILFLFY